MVVQHNLTAMNANRMLGVTTDKQAKATEKLSSGYKINRAADDAAGLSISEKMRKQIRGLTQASSNAEDGISSVQTAEGALTEVHDMLQRMNELAVKASNGTNSESDRQSIQDEIDQLITEIDRVSETTKFNETYLLKGDETVEKKVDWEYSKLAYTAETTLYDSTGTEVKKGVALDSTQTYYTERTATGQDAVDVSDKAKDIPLLNATAVRFDQAVYTRAEDGSVTYVAAGTSVAVGTTVYATATDAAKDDLTGIRTTHYDIKADDVNGDAHSDAWENTSGATITKGVTSTGLKWDDSGTPTDIKMAVAEATSTITLYKVDANSEEETIAAGEKFAVKDIYSTDPTVKLYKAVQYQGDTNSAITSADFENYANAHQLMDFDGNEVAANGLYSYFEEVTDATTGNTSWQYKGGLYLVDDDGKRGAEATKAQVDSYVKETTKDTGALTLTLHVGADATTNNQISVDIDAMSASSLGIKNVKVTGKDDTNALNAIETIKAAIQQVSEQRSALGAVQNRLEHTINNLDNVVENTTSAESQIRDTDMASAMVEYSKNNILQQAGQSMLAQANQANQGVLSLLQ